MRNRILAIILVAGCVVTTLAHALGLGDIEVYSALNQPLAAEIELSSVRPGEVDNMRVKLAGEDAFLQAGVERPFYLTKLKFNLATKPDGTQYINVTTQDPIREPFLNFLVDVDWPRGRLVREYTILLDPPVFAGAQKAAPTQTEAAPVTAVASTTGTPALIKRDDAAVADDDFGFDDAPADSVAAEDEFAFDEPAGSSTTALQEQELTQQSDDFANEEFGAGVETDREEAGFGVTEKAEPADLSAGLPDISITAAEQEATAFEDDQIAKSDTGEFEDFQNEDSFVAGIEANEELEVETATEEELADESEYQYSDDVEGEVVADQADDASESEFVGSGMDEALPDISLFYDASLPYDEDATNALLAQFAAEDEARMRGEAVAGADEHLVEAGDTLHEIASRYKAPDVAVDQAMLSILRYNPDAFIKDNINSVKKGFVLRIPDRETMLQIDSTEAMAEVRQQYALWREYRDQLVGAPSTARDAQTADDLYIAESSADGSGDSGSELSILSPGRDENASGRASGAQEGSDTGSSLYVDLQLAQEQLQAERLEKEELQARLTDLTGQREKQDRIISVQNEQLARLQQRLGELDEQTTDVQQIADNASDASESTPSFEPDSAGSGSEEVGLILQAGNEDEELSSDSLVEQADTTAEVDEMADAEQVADSDQIANGKNRFKLDFEDDFEPGLQTEEPLNLQSGNQADGDVATAADGETSNGTESEPEVVANEEETSPQDEPVLSERERPKGLAGWVYDNLPKPYNIMAAEFLGSSIEIPFLGSVGISILSGAIALLLVLLIVALKPKKKKPTKVSPVIDDTALEEDTHLTVEPAKHGFGERLSSMFSPITSIFGSGKKGSIAALAAKADHSKKSPKEPTEYPDDVPEFDAVIEDLGEIESFDDTAKSAAQMASTQTGNFASTRRTVTTPGVVKQPAVAQEEAADDTTQEADVYLAYGLHDQAEELLTQALALHPEKVDYKGKLLETYFAAGKKSEFETLAADLHGGLGGGSSRVWDKAVAMGKEIAPDNALFSDVADPGLKVSDFAPAKPATADLDLSEPQGSMTPDIAFDEEDTAASTSTDFDLDLSEAEDDIDATVLVTPGNRDRTEIMSTVDVESMEEEVERHDTDLQFDLEADADDMASDLNIDFNADELGLDTEIDSDTSGMDSMDSDSHMADDDATVAMELAFNLDDESAEDLDEEDEDEIELDVGASGEISLDDLDDVFEADSSASDDLLADLDLGSDDLRAASVDTEFEIPEDDDTIIDADLDDETISGDIGDEVATKLDLAKAYMDMGDYDGASSTLEEVITEGDDSQRAEAEELLDQIH